eukprot:TRINITY_DN9616_c0_g1_i1.p2 TRINITY_DN9616_c0_g1~~TRINITY_DN9616_c0_g1_i1.p2  ORF type:complete len:144 (+),score=12.32 TRINITY_DN9616_c0_g1_i1:391-822(+)
MTVGDGGEVAGDTLSRRRHPPATARRRPRADGCQASPPLPAGRQGHVAASGGGRLVDRGGSGGRVACGRWAGWVTGRYASGGGAALHAAMGDGSGGGERKGGGAGGGGSGRGETTCRHPLSLVIPCLSQRDENPARSARYRRP